jgi:hypothetical protein
LTAELTAAHSIIGNGLNLFSVVIAGFEHVGDQKAGVATLQPYLPRFNPSFTRPTSAISGS